MAKHSSSGHDNKETMIGTIGGVLVAAIIMIGLIWFLASHKIVYYSSPILWFFALPWYYFDGGVWSSINEAYVYFRQNPGNITLPYYMGFANTCLKPLAVFVCSLAGLYVFSLFFKKSGGASIKRELSPMAAAKEISKTFPAIIPVLHLGPKLVKDELPLWRRQTFPEDVWMNEKIKNRSMVEGGQLNLERVAIYFRGGEEADGKIQVRSGRRWSKMLGYQVVDLIEDRGKQGNICFPNRFSSQGKVIFAILCAHAFGGRDGKKDYKKATDELNRSCSGQENGLPNLKVAQWIFDKYKNDPTARKLFSVHHWEYTYLFALFMKAKLTGKATHTDFLWLKPLDRIMFYALNTVGRSTPPVEAAAVFSQIDYEIQVAKAQRLPLVQRPNGKLIHHIAVGTAVEGLLTEFTRYQQCYDDADDWWQELKTWTGADVVVRQTDEAAKQIERAKAEMELAAKKASQQESSVLTDFDLKASSAAKAKEAKLDEAERESIAREISSGGSIKDSASGKSGGTGQFDFI